MGTVTTTTGPERRPQRPPRALNVVWDPTNEELEAEIDWSVWYLTDEEDMGESGEQNLIIRALLSMLAVLARERGWSERVLVGADQFFAWIEEEPLVRVSPDVYLLDDPPPRPLPASFQTWVPGHKPPRLAIEIVSGERWQKDYRDNPPKYSQLGARELIIFDPEAAIGGAAQPERVPLQVFRHEADGAFVRVCSTCETARSEELDAWVVVLREGGIATLGLARDAEGRDLVPTAEQALDDAERRLAVALEELERLRVTRDR